MRSEFQDSELPKLIAIALEVRDRGVEPQLEEICHESPHLIEAVKSSLELSDQLPALQRISAGRDRFAGRTLASRYRLDSRVGAGAMGVVYKGWDEELHRPVAVKILNLPLGDEEGAELRFTREAEALAAIAHEAVVRIYDRGRTGEDDPFLVMEFIEGPSLSRLLVEIKGTPGSTSSKDTQAVAKALGVESVGDRSYLRTAVRWMADAANGLAVAHRKGIFHRDIKPSNILINRDAGPVVVDFGIAAQSSKDTITRDGDLIGTPAFMAPEALQEGIAPGPALDVYGLTATLYELLTLRPPYAGTPTQVLTALSQRDPESAARVGAGLPVDLLAILECGMARRPNDRYASMFELEQDLRAFLEYRPVKARRTSAIGRAWRGVRRSAAWRAGVAVAVVAIAVALGMEARSVWLEGRRVEFREVWKHIPPNLGVAGPATRVLSRDEGRYETEALLNRAVELSDHVFPATLMRAVFREDHGLFAGAARDMGRVAAALGTDYLIALNSRYQTWADSGGVGSVELADLPPAETAMDCYAAAVFALRVRNLGAAVRLLGDPRLAEFIPAQELATLLIGDRAKQLERGIWLEERIGCRTANTASMICLSLLLKQDYDAAYDVAWEGLELAPGSHTLLMNAARSAWMLERLETAGEHYRQVLSFRPDNVQAHELYVRFLTDSGLTEEAQVELDAAPFGAEDKWRALRHELQGGIEAERALQFLSLGQKEAAREAALRSETQFEEVGYLGENIDSNYSRVVCEILQGEANPRFWTLTDSLIKQPWSAVRIQVLESSLPAELDVLQTNQIRRLLKSFRDAFVSRGLTENAHLQERPVVSPIEARN